MVAFLRRRITAFSLPPSWKFSIHMSPGSTLFEDTGWEAEATSALFPCQPPTWTARGPSLLQEKVQSLYSVLSSQCHSEPLTQQVVMVPQQPLTEPRLFSLEWQLAVANRKLSWSRVWLCLSTYAYKDARFPPPLYSFLSLLSFGEKNLSCFVEK